MTLRLTLSTVIILIIAAACQSGLPDKIIEVEVTRIVIVTATEPQTTGPVPIQDGTTVAQNIEATPSAPTSTQLEATSTPDVFPTPIIGQMFVAEQDFQNAKMFWLQPINQIWILQTNEDGENVWIVQDDLFEGGMPENDPLLTPPAEGLIQPIRGFGFLWRENDALRSQVGWAIGEEVGYNANYEYYWGGTVDENNVYVSGPGYHQLQTYSQDIYRFDEEARTWEIIAADATATPEAETESSD
jgi:hypothetical protein